MQGRLISDFHKLAKENQRQKLTTSYVFSFCELISDLDKKYIEIKLGDYQNFMYAKVKKSEEQIQSFTKENEKKMIVVLKEWKLTYISRENTYEVIIYKSINLIDFERKYLDDLKLFQKSEEDLRNDFEQNKKVKIEQQRNQYIEYENSKICFPLGAQNIVGRVLRKGDTRIYDQDPSYYEFEIFILLENQWQILPGTLRGNDNKDWWKNLKVDCDYLFNGVRFYENSPKFFLFSSYQAYSQLQLQLKPILIHQDIETIKQQKHETRVDLVAIVKELIYTDNTRITYILIDQSGEIKFTIWINDWQQQNHFESGNLIVAKNFVFRINQHGAFYVNSSPSSLILRNDVCENIQTIIKELEEWYLIKYQTSKQFKSIEELAKQIYNKQQEEPQVKPIQVMCSLEFPYITMYLGCSICNRKITSSDPCSCSQGHQTIEKKIRVKLDLRDSTGSVQVTAFQENAEKILGYKLEDFQRLSNEEKEKAFEQIKKKQFLFQLYESNYNFVKVYIVSECQENI